MTPPCIICYSVSSGIISFSEEYVGVAGDESEKEDLERLKLFFKLLGRYVDRDGEEDDDKTNFIDEVINTGILSSCRVESFCDLYHKLKSIELLIHWKVRALKEIMSSAQGDPSKVRDFQEVVAKKLNIEGESVSAVRSVEILTEFKENLIQKCRRRLHSPFPRLVIKQNDSLGPNYMIGIDNNVNAVVDGIVTSQTLKHDANAVINAVIASRNLYHDQHQQPTMNDFADSERNPKVMGSILRTSSNKSEDNLVDEIYQVVGAEDDDLSNVEMDADDTLTLGSELESCPPPTLEEYIVMENDTGRMQSATTLHSKIKRRKMMQKRTKKRKTKKKVMRMPLVTVPAPIITTSKSGNKFAKPRFRIIPSTNQHKCLGSDCSKVLKNYAAFESHWNSTHFQIRYKCTACLKIFRRRDNYGVHYRGEHLQIRFQCPICKEMFSRRTLLRTHLQRKHSNEEGWTDLANRARPINLKDQRRQTIKQAVQRMILDVSRKVSQDMASSEPKKGMSMDHVADLNKNLVEASEALDDDTPAMAHTGLHSKNCNRDNNDQNQRLAESTETKNELNDLTASRGHPSLPMPPPIITSHSKVVHAQKPSRSFDTNTGMHTCDTCSKQFKTTAGFYSHRDSFHLQLRYKCPLPLCGKQFHHFGTYKIHHRSEHMCLKFRCGVKTCSKPFSRRSLLKGHLQAEHPDHFKQDMARKARLVRVKTQKLPLQHCGTHPNRHFKNKKVRDPRWENSFECIFCRKTFSDKSFFTRHIRDHIQERVYFCKLCPEEFGNASAIKSHYMSNHNSKRDTHCSKVFSARSNLSRHLPMKMEKQLRCSTCKENFPTLWHFGVHRKIHSKGKRFGCDECRKSFRTPKELKDHKLKHIGVKRYACQICPNAYFSLSSLQIHIRTHTLEKPFKCRFCAESFISCSMRSKHQRTGKCQSGEEKCAVPLSSE